MRKFLIVLGIVLITTPVFAQARGALPNTYASWFTVTRDTTITVVFPFNSRDLLIHNGDSSNGVVVNLRGNAINNQTLKSADITGPADTIQIEGTDTLRLVDFITGSISMVASTATDASPVTVIVTY